MSANLSEVNGQAAMAYVGDTPWHRLGKRVDGIMTVEIALAAAQLDWDAVLENMFLSDGTLVKNRRAVIRSVDRRQLGTVGLQFEPWQNRDAFGVLKTACDEHGVSIETAGALGNGERCWMLAKLPHVWQPVPGDKVEGYLLLINGHDGGTNFTARPTTTRVVCQNTIDLALKTSRAIVRIPHTRSAAEQRDSVGQMISILTGTIKTANDSFADLAAKKLTPKTVEQYINAVLGIPEGAELTSQAKRQRDSIVELSVKGKGAHFAPETAWSAFNAVTEHVDHVRSTTLKPARQTSADVSAAFGRTAVLKARALELALAL